jgi:hypothetical protein
MIQQEFYCSFLASTEDILIPFIHIQAALNRDVRYNQSGRIAGLDVARFGDDRTCLVIRQGGQLIYIDLWKGNDTVQSAGKIIQAYKNKFFDCIAIDVIGIGAGVYDMVKNAGVPCVAVNVSEASPVNDSRFYRMRDYLWWQFREWFLDSACSISPGIPQKEKDSLIVDISDIHYGYTPSGQIRIETKDEMKERLGFSPDVGDACIHTYHPSINMKLRQINRQPFGRVQHHADRIENQDTNPLTYGLEVRN